jgi:hypothetical protein
MEMTLRDLQSIVEENNKLLASSASIADYQDWGARRRALFDRLKDFQVSADDAPAAILLIKEIMRLDASILSRMGENLATLGEKLATACKVRQSIRGAANAPHSRFMRRVV